MNRVFSLGKLAAFKLFFVVFFLLVCQSSCLYAKNKKAEPIFKIKLGDKHDKIKIVLPDGGRVLDASGKRVQGFRKRGVFERNLKNHRGRQRTPLNFISNNGLVEFNGKTYRGSLTAHFKKDHVVIVNNVAVEDYLRGVVGGEMSSLAPLESLNSQAVIARTYAFAGRHRHKDENAELCDSTHCQVYFGIEAERKSVDLAVAATRSITMLYDGNHAETLYHSTCGGETSDSSSVFGGTFKPWLRRVQCSFCENAPNYRWSKVISLDMMRKVLTNEKINFDAVTDIEIVSPSYMDIVEKIVFKTPTSNHEIKGSRFRSLFKLPSMTFVIADKDRRRQMLADSLSDMESSEAWRINLQRNTLLSRQLFVQSAEGLHRASEPLGGWGVLSVQKILKTSPKPQLQDSFKSSVMSQSSLDKISLFGRGYGHQVGLCQSGAIELGKRGWNYRQILSYYYSDVSLASLAY